MLVVDGDGVVRQRGPGVVCGAHGVRVRGAHRAARRARRAHRAHCAYAGRANLLIICDHNSRRIWLSLWNICLCWSRFNCSSDFMFSFSSFWFHFDTCVAFITVFGFSRCFGGI